MIPHVCKPILRRSAAGVDGQKYRCSCGKVWEYTQEGAGYWVSQVKSLPKDESYRKKRRQQLRKEAQRVWAE